MILADARRLGGEDSRIKLLSERFVLLPSGMEVRELGNRWGSCNDKGKLYFNWKLLQMPTRLVDYVITHELVHLVEPKHGPAFWSRLERIMPDYQAQKDELLNSSKEYLVL
jgi:predicted metal-dependent hydrolase